MNKIEQLHLSVLDKLVITDYGYTISYKDECATKSTEITKEITLKFLKWCNEPTYRNHNEITPRTRVIPQAPDFNTFIIIDETGHAIHFEHGEYGKFLNGEQVFQEFLKTI